MDSTSSEKQKANSIVQHGRKRKRKQKKVEGLSVERQNASGIDNLPDEILTAILSYMNLKEAVRTSVLSRRWRYLWMFRSGTLEFNDGDSTNGIRMPWKTFKAWVDRVLKLHQGPHIDSLIFRFSHLPHLRIRSGDIDKWVYFAMQKEVKRFELNLSMPSGYCSKYKFPNIEKLLSRSHEVKPAFGSLRSLRLVDVPVEDEVVQYFLASCPYLEQLCIRNSYLTNNLQFVEPLPNLKVLEISECYHIQSLEISAVNLVSFKYEGKEISLPFKKIPNLSELTLGGLFCQSFICEPNKHSSYSAQLVKLTLNFRTVVPERAITALPDFPQLYSLKRLELDIVSRVGRVFFFFISLIKASPLLHEFRIKTRYKVGSPSNEIFHVMFPEVGPPSRFDHKNLKVVEVGGYIGCWSDERFLLELFKVAPSLEMVTIDTHIHSEYYEQKLSDWEKVRPQMRGARTRVEAKERASRLQSSLPPEAVLVIR